MAVREVELTFDVVDYQAGALFELWLQRDGSPWGLVATGAVENAATQTFRVINLVEATEYKAQLRQSLLGRYRDDYLGSSPDSWPAQSLLEFTTGAP